MGGMGTYFVIATKKGLQRVKQSIQILNWAKQECSECRQFLQEQKTLKCFERGEERRGGWGKGGGVFNGRGSSLLSV